MCWLEDLLFMSLFAQFIFHIACNVVLDLDSGPEVQTGSR